MHRVQGEGVLYLVKHGGTGYREEKRRKKGKGLRTSISCIGCREKGSSLVKHGGTGYREEKRRKKGKGLRTSISCIGCREKESSILSNMEAQDSGRKRGGKRVKG